MIYNNFINRIMVNGKKSKSEKILTQTLKKIQKHKKHRLDLILKFAIINSSPFVNVRQIQRKRKQIIEFPYLLNNKLRIFYSIRNLTKKKILANLLESAGNLGNVVKFKKAVHKDAFLKKKIANYRWF